VNSYDLMDGRAVANAELITLKDGKKLGKVRLADNPAGKKDDKRPARFLTAKAFGTQGEALSRLSQGDVISAVGELILEKYTDKDGNERTADVLMISKFRVHKSESFFAKKEGPSDEADVAGLFDPGTR